jgi:CubicO group peptidase (beta-lactamase class C family)/DNA-binding ferritin-like protein (Dps family)
MNKRRNMMENNIFSTLKNLITGENWKQEKAEYKRYKERIHALPKDYQIVMNEIENFLYIFASDRDSTMAILKALRDVLELFESSVQEKKDVLDVVGEDVSGFCDDLLKEIQVQTWTEKRKEQLSENIRKKLGKEKVREGNQIKKITTEDSRSSENIKEKFIMTQNNKGFSETGLRKMREVLARYVDSGKIPGLVALVSRNGETHVEALGTMRHDGGAPMRQDTIFRMASTSKPVSVAATMILIDECRLRLDDLVETWLPELANRQVLKRIDGPLDETVPARRPITVRDLLTSTFGLGMDMTTLGTPIMNAIFEQGLTPNLPVPMPEPDEWMRRLGTLPLMHHPGEHWQYHISNDLLGVLVARVTGQTFETFLRERIFEPLGMKDTGFHVPENKIDRLPTLYAPDPQTGEFTVWDESKGGRWSQPPVFQGGGGGLVSTVDDYHAYFQMLLNQGMHGNKRILSRQAVQLMTTNRLTPEQTADREAMAKNNVHVSFGQGQHGGWGFGMAVRTYRGDYASIGQFGWDGGTGTSSYADPDNQLIGILATQVGLSIPDPAYLMHDFWTTVYQAIEE